ncbi:MAG: hypothetical protein M1828_000174 [Chrysothrix sp. TS-e1954]|nr:MAG: hypothetical protein M1828_000174 [Chrysothrix sp. TS-e1954]
MPHKHKRNSRDASSHDLPPNSVAEALPVGKVSRPGRNDTSDTRKRKRKPADLLKDDTPAEFRRIMAMQTADRRPSGYDDGTRPNKRRKVKSQEAKSETQPTEKLTRQPREKFSDFASRIDQSLPITGLSRKGRKAPEMKERSTRLQKKITRMQDAWRVEEARRKEKREEALDEAELEDAIKGVEDPSLKSARKSTKKRKGGDANDEDEADPWAKLKASRGQRPALTDVAKAPPTFKRLPKSSFKVQDNAMVDVGDIPTSAGSLRRREQLSSARKEVIEEYRRMMGVRRDA